LKKTPLEYQKGKLVLHLPESLEALDGEAVRRRMKILTQFLNCDLEVRTGSSQQSAIIASSV
jgi:hypothetical protein